MGGLPRTRSRPQTSRRERVKRLTTHMNTLGERIELPEPPIRKAPPPIQETPEMRDTSCELASNAKGSPALNGRLRRCFTPGLGALSFSGTHSHTYIYIYIYMYVFN